MIQLHTDCLVFETSDGEAIPCSAQDVTVELLGEAARELDEQIVEEAAAAALYFFKQELNRNVVSVGEFTMALERILRGFGYKVKPIHDNAREAETNLHDLAHQAGEGLEMVFFCTLRDQIHADLNGKPEVLRVKGLRDAVRKLTGAEHWTPRCQKLNDQIVDYLRDIVARHRQEAKLTLMIV
ncbi:MAG: hypothetical protein CMO74_04255 [Verrucomicrobiales bacterium]|nr:hypothetical protein [Verrucomicrobiales bacterium]|tara:strand:- start:1223 stop:1771 length:549 start_codon:yes stop_codon:yes gene_type:complete